MKESSDKIISVHQRQIVCIPSSLRSHTRRVLSLDAETSIRLPSGAKVKSRTTSVWSIRFSNSFPTTSNQIKQIIKENLSLSTTAPWSSLKTCLTWIMKLSVNSLQELYYCSKASNYVCWTGLQELNYKKATSQALSVAWNKVGWKVDCLIEMWLA